MDRPYCARKKEKIWREEENPGINKAIWNEKRKKWVYLFFTQTGYIQQTVAEVFIDLKDEKSDTKDFKSATIFVPCCVEKLQIGDFALEENVVKTNIDSWTLDQKASPWSKICFMWLFRWHKIKSQRMLTSINSAFKSETTLRGILWTQKTRWRQTWKAEDYTVIATEMLQGV